VDGAPNVPAGDTVLPGGAAPGSLPDDERECGAILNVLADAGIFGASAAQIASAANLDCTRTNIRIGELLEAGRVRELRRPAAAIAADVAGELFARAVERLRERQTERPWLAGLTSLALAQALGVPEAALVRVLAGFVEGGQLASRSGYYSTPGFSPRLTAEQQHFFDRAFGVETGAPLGPVLFAELRAQIKSSSVPELRQAFETLVASGALSKVGEFVYLGSQITAIRAQLESELKLRQSISVAQFRTLTGTSRKYAVPLLEFFDAVGVTRRSGDLRVLRPEVSPERSRPSG
jgi:selenocysteine-specific elongation factor